MRLTASPACCKAVVEKRHCLVPSYAAPANEPFTGDIFDVCKEGSTTGAA